MCTCHCKTLDLLRETLLCATTHKLILSNSNSSSRSFPLYREEFPSELRAVNTEAIIHRTVPPKAATIVLTVRVWCPELLHVRHEGLEVVCGRRSSQESSHQGEAGTCQHTTTKPVNHKANQLQNQSTMGPINHKINQLWDQSTTKSIDYGTNQLRPVNKCNYIRAIS